MADNTIGDNRGHGWKVALVVALIGAAASIIAAVIVRDGGGGESDAASPVPPIRESSTRPPVPDSPSATEFDTSRQDAGSVYLVDIRPVERDNVSVYDDPAVVDGVTYVHPLSTYHSKGQAFLEYDLGRRYSSFQATVGVSDDSDSATRKRLEVYGDGRLLASAEVGLGMSQKIDVPIKDVLRLKLVQITLNDGFAKAYVIWGDAQLVT